MFKILKKIGKIAGAILDKAICIFDDIPFLLKGIGVLTGLFTLIGAGYLIFGLQLYKARTELQESLARKEADESRITAVITSLGKVFYAILGLVFTTGLLIATSVALVILAVATSAAAILAAKTLLLIAGTVSAIIPLMMAVVAGIELLQAINDWTYARDVDSKEEAKTSIFYNSIYFGLAIAVTALATITVILGPGIPTYILIGVIGVSIAIKLYEERDEMYSVYCTIRDAIKTKWNECIFWLTNKPELTNTLTDKAIVSTRASLSGTFGTPSSGESLSDLQNSSDPSSEKEEVVVEVLEVRQVTPVTPVISIPQPSFSTCNDDKFVSYVYSCSK